MIRVLMDYHIAMKSLDCPYTVTFYGAMFREVKKKILRCSRYLQHFSYLGVML